MAQGHCRRQAQRHPYIVQRDEPTLAPLLGGVTAREEGAHLVGVGVGVRVRVWVRVRARVRVRVRLGLPLTLIKPQERGGAVADEVSTR